MLFELYDLPFLAQLNGTNKDSQHDMSPSMEERRVPDTRVVGHSDTQLFQYHLPTMLDLVSSTKRIVSISVVSEDTVRT